MMKTNLLNTFKDKVKRIRKSHSPKYCPKLLKQRLKIIKMQYLLAKVTFRLAILVIIYAIKNLAAKLSLKNWKTSQNL